MRVRDDELDTSEATLDQAAKEAAPERLGLALTDIETDHLPVTGLVHPVGQYQTLAHHPGAVTDLLDLRIEPQIRVGAPKRTIAERVEVLVETLADPRDLALGDPQSERLDNLVNLPR